MRSERICSLGRKLGTITTNFTETYVGQWFERTLDDSAIRRMDIPESFLLADAILISLDNVSNGSPNPAPSLQSAFDCSTNIAQDLLCTPRSSVPT